jgi:glycosyltransferase involved in cell wall biosynthesis
VYATSAASRRSVAAAAALREDDVSVLPIPVDTDAFVPAPEAEWRAGLAAPRVVFVGRGDDPRKNVALLLDAWRDIGRNVPAAKLVLVGRPPDGSLPARAEAVGESRSVAAELRRGSLFVLPSRQEGFGIVAAEALAAGLPVVTTPSGGPEELVRRSRGGVVIGSHAADELAETVTALLREPEVLASMRARGRAYVEHEHSPTRFRQQLATAFAEVEG